MGPLDYENRQLKEHICIIISERQNLHSSLQLLTGTEEGEVEEADMNYEDSEWVNSQLIIPESWAVLLRNENILIFRLRDANEVTPDRDNPIRDWLEYFARNRKRNQNQEPEERIKNWIQHFTRKNDGMTGT